MELFGNSVKPLTHYSLFFKKPSHARRFVKFLHESPVQRFGLTANGEYNYIGLTESEMKLLLE
jgi:hypothetical protein